MNWLAHFYLSEPSPAFWVGNILPDLLPQSELLGLSPQFRAGAEQHRRIDSYTDSHTAFRRSKNRLLPIHRRFGGIIVDVFYDHFLAAEWPRFSAMPLRDFASEVYEALDLFRNELPAEAMAVLDRMRDENWLVSYREIAGARSALDRIGRRLRNPMNLGDSVDCLSAAYSEFKMDFDQFFPELAREVGT